MLLERTGRHSPLVPSLVRTIGRFYRWTFTATALQKDRRIRTSKQLSSGFSSEFLINWKSPHLTQSISCRNGLWSPFPSPLGAVLSLMAKRYMFEYIYHGNDIESIQCLLSKFVSCFLREIVLKIFQYFSILK